MNFFIEDTKKNIVFMADEDKITAVATIIDKINIHYDSGIEQQTKFNPETREILFSDIQGKGEILKIEILNETDDTLISIEPDKIKCNSDTIGKYSITDDYDNIYEGIFNNNTLFLGNLYKV